MLKIKVVTQNRGILTTFAHAGQSFLDIFFNLQLSFHQYFCAGTGLCGKCAMQFLSQPPDPDQGDLARFTPDQIENGWRLACKHMVRDSCSVRVFDEVSVFPMTNPGQALLLDLGTTQIKWACWDALDNGEVYQISNPQLAIGADVMSRLLYARRSDAAKLRLQHSLLYPMQKILKDIQPQLLGIAGNTVMISLLMGLPLQGLATAPYHLSWSAGVQVSIDGLGRPAYIPPLFGPFVGADVSAGLAYIQELAPAYPYLFIDVGTNAEFVLALSPMSFYACSVPMGPAIEGVGLSCGAIAGDHILTKVESSVHDLLEKEIAGNWTGISGSGYLGIIADLYRTGALDAQGHFTSGETPMAKKIFSRIKSGQTGRFLSITDSLFITEKDIEEVLKVKAVFSLAIKILLTQAKVTFSSLQQIYMSGSFGSNVNTNDLITVGFLPILAQEKAVQIPNTVLRGLYLALTSRHVREWLNTIALNMSVVDIVLEDNFNQRYAQSICLGWA